jgi:hypothetical protein
MEGKGLIQGKVIKEVKKKFVACSLMRCPYGLKKIDEPCSWCHNRKDIVLAGEVEPIFIKVTDEFKVGCYKKEGVEAFKKCPFNISGPSELCANCARFTKNLINSKTENIK